MKITAGIAFNGGDGEFDTTWLRDESTSIKEDALNVYWVLQIRPSLGFMTGGTRVTVSGINFEAVGKDGDNTKMRCRFGSSVVFPDVLQIPDPVDFRDGTIQCTSPQSLDQSMAQKDVLFGICLIGIDCEYTGKSKQAALTNTYIPNVDHYTKSSPYLYYRAPQLLTLTPSLGPQEGSTYITINGIGFLESPALSCRFDLGSYSTASTLVDSSTAICKTPAATTSRYSVEITLNGQQYSGGCVDKAGTPVIDVSTGKKGICLYYFYEEPEVVKVSPQAGVNTGNTQVVLIVEKQIVAFFELQCIFKAVYGPDQERLAMQRVSMIKKAETEPGSNTVRCFSPTSLGADGKAILRASTSNEPTRGKTYVSLTWNGQQFGPSSAAAKTQFWFHDPVEVVSLMPFGGQIDTASQLVTLSGENFLNVTSLTVKFGSNLYLCSPGAELQECPNDDTHVRDAVWYLSANTLLFKVPVNAIAARKNVKVSNNGLPQEFTTTSVDYVYYSKSDECPRECKGMAPAGANAHGTCVAKGDGRMGCNCNQGYSGIDCSTGPSVQKLEPSSGLVTGGWLVTVIGQNIWNYDSTLSNKIFKVLLDSRKEVAAQQDINCWPKPSGGGAQLACIDKLVFEVPTSDMRVSLDGITVEITVNGDDYTFNRRLLQIFGVPSISSLVPNGAHYLGEVAVT